MKFSWWSMPGPSRFLSSARRALSEGVNIVLHSPSDAKESLLDALGRSDDGIDLRWEELSVQENGGALPEVEIVRRFMPGDRIPKSLSDAQSVVQRLHESSRFRSRAILVKHVDASDWPSWTDFLMRYQHECLRIPLSTRTVFCVAAPYCDADFGRHREIRDDVALRHFEWKGQVSILDAELYASHLMSSLSYPPLIARILAKTIAYLSGYDANMAATLATKGPNVVLHPMSFLRQYAAEREWEPLEDNNIELRNMWHAGRLDFVDGSRFRHSACAALSYDAGAFNMVRSRLWKAQIGILFPILEDMRSHFLQRTQDGMTVPWERQTGEVVADLGDLELGDIVAQLYGTKANVWTNGTLSQLRIAHECRNDLAHLKPLAYNRICELHKACGHLYGG